MGAKQCQLIESIDYSIPPCYPSDEELEKIKKHIVKHSKNIIDLIEVGDIIKFKELATEEKYGTIVNQIYISDIHDNDELNFIKEEIERKGIEIISIVTKEQFASMEYKIEEEDIND